MGVCREPTAPPWSGCGSRALPGKFGVGLRYLGQFSEVVTAPGPGSLPAAEEDDRPSQLQDCAMLTWENLSWVPPLTDNPRRKAHGGV